MTEYGYCEIGIYRPKTPMNVGTLWRSAYQLGASGIFTIGQRYPKQSSDTTQAYRHIPFREYLTLEEWHAALPYDAPVIGIDMGGKYLWDCTHPERAIYLLGAEDKGLDNKALKYCHRIISLESVRSQSYNVAVAGSLVLYHRLMQQKYHG